MSSSLNEGVWADWERPGSRFYLSRQKTPSNT